ncbi:MAG: helix-turn-helix transcriptional regulator [Ruminococcaceae bacterium]|nr:helix-turn-helix transcriptional regulator [Oscillospiraceae bacterium]
MNTFDKAGIGQKIRERREKLGMSQEELAKLIGYTSRSTINKIEMGKIDIAQSKIEKFARALDIPPVVLMGWDYPLISDMTLPNLDNLHVNSPIHKMRNHYETDLFRIVTQLSNDQLNELIEFAKSLYESNKKQD